MDLKVAECGESKLAMEVDRWGRASMELFWLHYGEQDAKIT